MKTTGIYAICLTLALVVTVAAFAAIDWVQETEPKPMAYIESLWLDGLGGGK